MRFGFCSGTLTILLASGLLSGCSLSERFLSPIEKVHRAFPPSAEVRVALEDARETFRNDPDALKTLEHRIVSQNQLRSLACTQGLTIGRLDSVEEVKALPIKQECLVEQDELLAAAVGTFHLDYLLAQPTLRPLVSLDGSHVFPKLGGGSSAPVSFDAASQANVLLVRGARSGELASVEIPSGKTLTTLPNIQVNSNQVPISPNGRLAAFATGNAGVAFLDMERGKKLWETRKFNGFYAWLPDVRAALVRETKSGAPMLLDLETGRLEAYAAGSNSLSWVMPTAEKGTVWLGSIRDVFRVEHVRTKDGLLVNVTKNFRLTETQGVTSGTPTLMNQGKTLFFVSHRDFGSLDLESGQETVWNVADFLANRYAKLSETTLLVESYSTNGGVDLKTWVLDIANRTLAPVGDASAASARNGLLMGLVGRTGWIRRGHEATYLGGAVQAEAPQPLDGLASSFNQERQIAKLESMERHEREMADITRLMNREQRFGCRPAGATPYAPAYGAPYPAAKSCGVPQAGLPQSAQVEAVGVYQGTGSSGGLSADGRKMGAVDVRVRRGSTPVILVLSSYEPVQWKISLDPGAQLAGVLLSGYYQSRVTGAGSARVLQMGRMYAYQRGTNEYNILNQEVRAWTGGQPIRVFQGRYEGGSYTVGG